MLIMQKNKTQQKNMQQQLGTDRKRKHIDRAIIFFSMKRCVVTDNVFEMSFLSFGYACPSDYQAADKQSKDVRCWMLNCLAWSIDFGYSKWIGVYCLWEVWPQLLLRALPICQQFCHDLFDQIKAQGWKQKEIHAESSGALQ